MGTHSYYCRPVVHKEAISKSMLFVANRYNIFEDFGPYLPMVITPLTFVLVSAWPVAIGTVCLYYCGECPGLPSFGGLSHSLQL